MCLVKPAEGNQGPSVIPGQGISPHPLSFLFFKKKRLKKIDFWSLEMLILPTSQTFEVHL